MKNFPFMKLLELKEYGLVSITNLNFFCYYYFMPMFFYAGDLTLEDVDRAYFGTTFPNLFLMTYSHLKLQKDAQSYTSRVFGFKIHKP